MAKETYREVYEKHNGPIKPGWVVHHCDLDHSNDAPNNLIGISKGLHIILHRVIKWLSKDPNAIKQLGYGLLEYGDRLEKEANDQV